MKLIKKEIKADFTIKLTQRELEILRTAVGMGTIDRFKEADDPLDIEGEEDIDLYDNLCEILSGVL